MMMIDIRGLSRGALGLDDFQVPDEENIKYIAKLISINMEFGRPQRASKYL
jgi:hypothetical protein